MAHALEDRDGFSLERRQDIESKDGGEWRGLAKEYDGLTKASPNGWAGCVVEDRNGFRTALFGYASEITFVTCQDFWVAGKTGAELPIARVKPLTWQA